MNSIGWGGRNSGNVAAIRTIPPTMNPGEYNKNQVKGLQGPSEPVPTYGSSRLPITKDADQWGFRTAYSTQAGEKNPSFNSTYLEADPKYAGLALKQLLFLVVVNIALKCSRSTPVSRPRWAILAI